MAYGRKDQAYVIDLCDELLSEKSLREHRFDWLRGDPNARGARAKLPVDAYYPRRKLVIEYWESQHDAPSAFFDKPNRKTVSGVHRGEQRARYDRRRKNEIPLHGLRLVIVRTTDLACDGRGRLLHHRDADRRTLVSLLNAALTGEAVQRASRAVRKNYANPVAVRPAAQLVPPAGARQARMVTPGWTPADRPALDVPFLGEQRVFVVMEQARLAALHACRGSSDPLARLRVVLVVTKLYELQVNLVVDTAKTVITRSGDTDSERFWSWTEAWMNTAKRDWEACANAQNALVSEIGRERAEAEAIEHALAALNLIAAKAGMEITFSFDPNS